MFFVKRIVPQSAGIGLVQIREDDGEVACQQVINSRSFFVRFCYFVLRVVQRSVVRERDVRAQFLEDLGGVRVFALVNGSLVSQFSNKLIRVWKSIWVVRGRTVSAYR